jgi:ArsR family transcriptional regulator
MDTLTAHPTASAYPTSVIAGTGSAQLPSLGDEKARELTQLFKLLADETRLRIIHYLTEQLELNVCSLCRLLKQSQPAVSHHLALLRAGGIIECRRDGKHNFYRLVRKQCGSYLDVMFGAARE